MNTDLARLQKLRSLHHEGTILQLAGTYGNEVAISAAAGDATGAFWALLKLLGPRDAAAIAFALSDGVADYLPPEKLWPLPAPPKPPAPVVAAVSAEGFPENEAWFRREYIAPLWVLLLTMAAAVALGAAVAVIIVRELL